MPGKDENPAPPPPTQSLGSAADASRSNLPVYEPPTLVPLGHLRDLTATGSFFGDT